MPEGLVTQDGKVVIASMGTREGVAQDLAVELRDYILETTGELQLEVTIRA